MEAVLHPTAALLPFDMAHRLSVPPLLTLVIGLVLLLLYLLPARLAFWGQHRNRYAIAALDVLLGWTVLGWGAALLWAVVPSRDRRDPP